MYQKWHSAPIRNHLNNKEGGLFGDNPYLISFLYAFDRACWAFTHKLKKKPDYVIFDRYATSNMVYQAMKVDTDEKKYRLIKFIKALEYGFFRIPKPDQVFMLEVPVDVSIERLKQRAVQDRYENEETQERARLNMMKVGNWLGWIRIPTSSSNGKRYSKEVIARMIVGPLKYKHTSNEE
jgi:dTMP kinase